MKMETKFYDENINNRTSVKPGFHSREGGAEMGGRKLGAESRRRNRRALGLIDQNVVASQPYPCVVATKRPIKQECITIYDENLPTNPVKRPITRKFAAQISSTQQQQQEVACLLQGSKTQKKLDPSASISIQNSNSEVAANLPVPMTLVEEEEEQPPSTTTTTTTTQMEVEMEDIFEEPVMDIDGCDANNPLALVDYVQDIYSYYNKMEASSSVSSDYMSQQYDINDKMRAILIDWLIEVHYKFELRDETLFLTVNLIDRFLAIQTVVRKKLQLVGLIAMLLACKYEEVSVPVVDDLIFISDKAYTRKDLLQMEKLMLNTLQFNLSLPTPYVFMRRYLKAAESDNKLELLSFFLIELALVEYEMLKYPPSLLAAAAVYTAQATLYGFKQWNKTCEWHTSYSEEQIKECSRMIVTFHHKAGTGKLTGVYRKYSTSKFGYAAKSQPALFLLDQEQEAAGAHI